MKLHQKKFNLIKNLLILKLGDRVKSSKEFDDEKINFISRFLLKQSQI